MKKDLERLTVYFIELMISSIASFSLVVFVFTISENRGQDCLALFAFFFSFYDANHCLWKIVSTINKISKKILLRYRRKRYRISIKKLSMN